MTHESDARTALERFVTDNDDLLALEATIGRFNIFDALNIVRAEIRHSNFLAFLLDPSESHGLGQLFLRGLLMDLLKAAPPDRRPFSPVEWDGTELRGIEIRREWNHIELLITCDEPRFAVVIENKIESSEHSNQLARYRAHIEADARRPALYVYLTSSGANPSDSAWIPYSYASMFLVSSRMRKTYENVIGGDVATFIDHYLNMIGSRFMDDPAIDELCRRIYRNHRQALELIFERAGRPGSVALADAEDAIRNDARFQIFTKTTDFVDFAPKLWLDIMPPWGLRREDPRSWIVGELSSPRKEA